MSAWRVKPTIARRNLEQLHGCTRVSRSFFRRHATCSAFQTKLVPRSTSRAARQTPNRELNRACGRDLLTSLRALSSRGLLSSTLSLDCCFSFRNSAVTANTKRRALGVRRFSHCTAHRLSPTHSVSSGAQNVQVIMIENATYMVRPCEPKCLGISIFASTDVNSDPTLTHTITKYISRKHPWTPILDLL